MWRFERKQNRLEFRTDEGVQPRAQVLFNPTRLVIDLPGTKLGRPKQSETVGGAFNTIRLAQFDQDTARIVLELDRGYTIAPEEIRFRYTTAKQWTVEIPKPKFAPLIANSQILSSRTIEVPEAPGVAVVTTTTQPAPGTSPPPSGSPRSPLPRIPSGRMVVVVDPGHGGPDPGAVGIGGLRETDIVLDIGRQVADLLERQGVTAVLTRTGEYDLGLEPRTAMANRLRASIFVSIHANAINMSRPDINGLETYYYDSGKELAEVIHETILEDTGVRDRRVRRARFYVLRHSAMPAVLVETGFVTGAEDAAKLSDPGYRSQMASAIARGILRYLGRGG
jgi:N-acetylmuramoyl-L-alanine amidase